MKSILRFSSSALDINSSNQPLFKPAGAGLPRGTPISSSFGHKAIASSTVRSD